MLIYAHRGASRDFPEHSLAAYREAIRQGADGFECDVRLTRDRQIICWHDRDTKRMTGENVRIADATLADLTFAKPLLFSDLLDLAIKNKKNIAVETKHPVPTRGLIEKNLLELLHSREAEIRKAGIDISIMSFSWNAVSRAKESGFNTVFLFIHTFAALFTPTPTVGPSLAAIRKNPDIVKRFHDDGKKVFVWTVNDDEDVRLCARAGVDVIMSDIPAQARKALG